MTRLFCLGALLATASLALAQDAPIGAYERGHRAFKDRNYRDAATWFDKAATGKRLFQARYWEGRSRFALRQWKQAEAAFVAAWRANQRSSTALLYLGRARLARNKHPEAVQALRSAANLKPRDATVLFWYGLALRRAGRPADALTPLRVAATSAPDDVDVALQLGWALLETQRPSEAIGAFQAACKLKPRSARNAKWLGIARVQAGQPRRGREALRASLRFDDTDAVTHYWMGRALLALRDAPTAIKAFQTALKLDVDWRTQLWLATAQENAGQRAAAIQGLTQATKTPAARGELLAALGRMHARAKRHDLASATLRRAAQALPRDASVQLDLARAALALKQRPPALRALEAAVVLDPKAIDAWRLLGALRFEQGDARSIRRARDALLKVTALGGDEGDRGLLGRALLRAGELSAALPHLVAGAAARPGDADLAIDLGVAQTLSGDAALAVRTLERAIEARPRDARALDYLGRAQHALGQHAKAKASFQASLQLRERAQPHRYLAQAALKERQTQPARQHAERAAKLAPDDPDCRRVAGQAADAAGDASAAFTHFARASDLLARSGPTALAAGRAGVQARQHRRALGYLRRAAELRQPPAEVARWQGDAHLALKAWANAIARYRVVLEARPKADRVWSRLGDAHLGARDPRAGAHAYARAVRLAPTVARYRRRLVIAHRRANDPASADEARRGWLGAAHPKLLDHRRTREVRLEATRLVIGAGPAADLAGEIHLLRAELLDARGDVAGADLALKEAERVSPWSYRVALRRGALATQLGQHTAAHQHFQAARERAPNRAAPAVAAAHARLRAGEVGSALSALRRATAQHPRSSHAALELLRLLALREQLPPALAALERLRPRLDAEAIRELRSTDDFSPLWSSASFRRLVGDPLRTGRPGSSFLETGAVRVAGPGASVYTGTGQLVD